MCTLALVCNPIFFGNSLRNWRFSIGNRPTTLKARSWNRMSKFQLSSMVDADLVLCGRRATTRCFDAEHGADSSALFDMGVYKCRF